MNKVRVGIVSVAHLHAFTYAEILKDVPDVQFIGIFDEDESRGQSASTKYATPFFANYDDLLARVDGVIICSANSLHYHYAKQAAEAGVHILVEKPITTVGEEARELIDLCKQQRVWLQTAFPVRMNTTIHQVKKRIDQGDIGNILMIAATNRSKMPGGWFVDPELSGGGAVLDHTVHVVDVLRWMLGSEVHSVYAEMGTLLHNLPVEDCGLLSMEFENGVVATLDTSWSRSKSFPVMSDVMMRIVGEKGVIHLDVRGQSGHLWQDDAELTHRQIPWGDNANEALIIEFIDCIRSKRPPLISGEDGLRAVEVAWAAYESAHVKKPVGVKKY